MVTASFTSLFVVRERVCDFVGLSYRTWALVIIRIEKVHFGTRNLKGESSESARETVNVIQNRRFVMLLSPAL